jgi:hypothetical protein
MIAVPYTAGEKESLHASLNRHRDVVRWKLEGLDDATGDHRAAPATASG